MFLRVPVGIIWVSGKDDIDDEESEDSNFSTKKARTAPDLDASLVTFDPAEHPDAGSIVRWVNTAQQTVSNAKNGKFARCTSHESLEVALAHMESQIEIAKEHHNLTYGGSDYLRCTGSRRTQALCMPLNGTPLPSRVYG